MASSSKHDLPNLVFSDEEVDDMRLKSGLEDLHAGDVIPVRMADVNNPLKFWVHIQTEKKKEEIDKLYNEMQ